MNGNSSKSYKSIDDLIKAGITNAYEDRDNYYLKVAPESQYDNSIYAVNKKTNKVTWMYFTEWIVDKSDFCKEIDPKNFKRG